MKCKNILLPAFILLAATCVTAQDIPSASSFNKLSKDSRGNDMLIGKCTRDGLLQASFAEWFTSNYDAYTVDSFTCTFIRPLLADKTITIFMGTWCGDSRREVPRVLKMLDCCGFPEKSISLVMVSNLPDAYKKSPGHEEEGKNIVRVPTIIIEENGKEVGRIIEFPVISLEKDMLAILKKENYKPNYQDMKISARR